MITQMKNKYIIHSRIIEKKFRSILLCFCLDIESSKIAKLSKISRQSINKIIKSIRILIAKECENISKMQGEIEIDESFIFCLVSLVTTSRRCKKSERKAWAWSRKENTYVWNVKEKQTSLYTDCQRLLY